VAETPCVGLAKDIDFSASGIRLRGEAGCAHTRDVLDRTPWVGEFDPVPGVTVPMSHMYAEWAAYLYPFNLTGNPAPSVPWGFTTAGLPVGLQLVGAYHDKQRLIDLAQMIESASGWSGRRHAC
jgi:hypothetical protein